MNYPHPIIAREGWLYASLSIVAAIIVTWIGGWWSLPFWLFALFVVQFFRDPPRPIPTDPRIVVCPADGRVVVVGKARDPYLDRDSLKISVFMNVFNVHSNRSPVDGTVKNVWYNAGGFFNAALDKASIENERNALHIVGQDQREITCVQVAGLVARRILCYVKVGDALSRGQRFGFIRFGSRVDVYLPIEARARVQVGDKVYASSTILAEFPAA